MTLERDNAFRKRLGDKLAQAGLEYARPSVPSKTLRAAMRIREVAGSIGSTATAVVRAVEIPHYWALYVHDGRGPFQLPPGQIMCWFRDPKDDPRLAGGYPVRGTDVKHLTKAQFNRFMQLNRVVEKAVYGRARKSGEPQVGPMIVTTKITKPTQAKRFFDNNGGMQGFEAKARQIGAEEFASFVKQELRSVLNLEITTKVKFG